MYWILLCKVVGVARIGRRELNVVGRRHLIRVAVRQCRRHKICSQLIAGPAAKRVTGSHSLTCLEDRWHCRCDLRPYVTNENSPGPCKAIGGVDLQRNDSLEGDVAPVDRDMDPERYTVTDACSVFITNILSLLKKGRAACSTY